MRPEEKKSFDPKQYPWAVVEYSNWDPPLVEAVPTVWLYGGRREEDASGATIFTASSYWPAQVAQVENFRRQMRNPGGRFGIVDSDLWESDHKVVVMDLVDTQERAFRHRDKATLTDHMDTTDVEDRGRGKRKKQAPHRLHASDEESATPPPLKHLKIQKGSSGEPKKGEPKKGEPKKSEPKKRFSKKKKPKRKSRGISSSDSSDQEGPPAVMTDALLLQKQSSKPKRKRGISSDDSDQEGRPAVTDANLHQNSSNASPTVPVNTDVVNCPKPTEIRSAGQTIGSGDRQPTDLDQDFISHQTWDDDPARDVNEQWLLSEMNAVSKEQSPSSPVSVPPRGHTDTGFEAMSGASPRNVNPTPSPPPLPARSESQLSTMRENVAPATHHTASSAVVTSSATLLARIRQNAQQQTQRNQSYLKARKILTSPTKGGTSRQTQSTSSQPVNQQPSRSAPPASLSALSAEVALLRNLISKCYVLLEKLWTVTAPPMERASTSNMPKLQLKSLKAMKRWHKYIEDEVNFFTAVQFLAAQADLNDLRTTVYNMLKSLMTNSLATHFNMDGRTRKDQKSKLAFKDTSTFKLIKVAVKKVVNDANKGKKKPTLAYSSRSVRCDCGRWLKDAPRRYSNEKKRKEKVQEENPGTDNDREDDSEAVDDDLDSETDTDTESSSSDSVQE